MAFGISADGGLFLGNKLIASLVTSITLRQASVGSPAYLLYTTRDNFLHTKPLLELLQGNDSQTPEPTIE